ncbi:site-specific DNA-methyltransferase [Euryhalocaulis caribicus]|uniref:site-specific DNA-methyltransferase n=1 Tax=Euryhalocaulis caribicus TaxID=1161401 RepID=UPI0003A0A89E|nr:DNA methyltransferase [Euryhalocaulis caribicus]
MSARIRDLGVETVSVSTLSPRASNPRTHSKKQLRQIAGSIETFGWTNPILVDAGGGIIAGHGRLEAARMLGLETVPVIRIEDMSEAQKRAYVIADNRLAETAGWDEEMLAIELQGLLEMDLDFDIQVIGFDAPEIDGLITGLDEGEADDEADAAPEPDPGPPVTDPGDLWLAGRHRLLCADATLGDSYARLMDGAKAQMVFTDPPYNVPIAGHVSGLGKRTHAEFAMASGEMTANEFSAFLKTVLAHLAAQSADGAIHFVCMDWRHIRELLNAGREVYSGLKNICVWNKTNGGMGSLYRSKHELVAVFKAGDAPHVNNVALGAHGRNRTNVWDYAGVNSFGSGRDDALAMHPTVKPVALVEDAILDCSDRGGIVLDPFMGSGSTLIAAERAGRTACGLELDPRYVDVTLRRFRQQTGVEPVHAASGLTFGELE